MINKYFKQMSKNQHGQALVEYALILIVSLLAVASINQTKESTEQYLSSSIGKNSKIDKENPSIKNIDLPNKVTSDEVWENISTPQNGTLSPVAFFSTSNPTYTNEPVTYWDGSYDPDGMIVKKEWKLNGETVSSPPSVFTSEGEYTITLEVEDNDKYRDTFTKVITVTKREEYTRLVYDHSKEVRNTLSKSSPYPVGSSKSLIIDQVFAVQKDLYNIEHIIITKNYVKTTQEMASNISYQINIPVLEVTYNGDGIIKSSTPYIDPDTGSQMIVTEYDSQVVSQPANITTVVNDNSWKFYVYNKISSVQDPKVSWGDKGSSYDYPRFDPETKNVTQSPSFVSSRTSVKESKYNPGYNITTPQCPTCTEPNRFTMNSVHQDDYRTVSYDSHSWTIRSHTRTHNYVSHEAYDWIYEYSGTGYNSTNTGKLDKLLRNSWTTEGWVSSEQVGGEPSNPTIQRTDNSTRPKYTDCIGDGWSDSCWQPEYNTTYYNEEWDNYKDEDNEEEQTVKECATELVRHGRRGHYYYRWEEVCEDVKQTRTCHIDYYERREYYYKWYGTDLQTSGFTWGYYDDDSEGCTDWADEDEE